MDDAWATTLKRGSELGGGKYQADVAATKSMLHSMLLHGAFPLEEESDSFGTRSLIQQVNNIKNILRSHSAAQS